MQFLHHRTFSYFLVAFLTFTCNAMFSPHYRKCILENQYGNDLGTFVTERIPEIRDSQYQYHPKPYYRKQITYQTSIEINFQQYLGSGASGQVYLVQQLSEDNHKIKSTPKVMKRFFSERIKEFEQQNYIMNLLGYPISWFIQTNPQRQVKQENLELTNSGPATIAIYPYYSSQIMHEINPFEINIPILLYKLIKQIEKSHANGVIHHDLKLQNIMIKIPNPNMDKIFDVQLIDWNLATFYYRGQASLSYRGTPCYMAPEILLDAEYVTPAIDIFSIGINILLLLINREPYQVECSKQQNLRAVARLVGINEILDLAQKYHLPIKHSHQKKLKRLLNKPQFSQPTDLLDLIPEQNAILFDQYLIDLLEQMLIADPQYRITASEILKHKYFDKVNKLPPMYSKKIQEQMGEMEGYDIETLRRKVQAFRERNQQNRQQSWQISRNE